MLWLQTLKHPEKRAAYDAIVGLSGDAINPFTDTAFERDQVCNCDQSALMYI